MYIIVESVLMLFTQNYQNQPMLAKTTACQSWLWDTVHIQSGSCLDADTEVVYIYLAKPH